MWIAFCAVLLLIALSAVKLGPRRPVASPACVNCRGTGQDLWREGDWPDDDWECRDCKGTGRK